MELHTVIKDVIPELDVLIPDCSVADGSVDFMVCVSDSDAFSVDFRCDDKWRGIVPRRSVLHGVVPCCGGRRSKAGTLLADSGYSGLAAHGEDWVAIRTKNA